MNPCVDYCFQRFGRQYTPECDNYCAYAKAEKQLLALQSELEQTRDKLFDAEMKVAVLTGELAMNEIRMEKLKQADGVVGLRQGKWEPGNHICPICGEDKFKNLDADIWCDWMPNFCPNCGARMNRKDDSNNGSAL